jgi:hypothetical protein
MRFSQKIGKKPIKTILQVESIDDDLLNRLWNVILEDFFNKLSDYVPHGGESEKGKICKLIWKEFFKKPVDKLPYYSNSTTVYVKGVLDFIRHWFYEAEWYEVYDLIEFLSFIDGQTNLVDFVEECNSALELEISGYRIVNDKIVQITSEEELKEIEEALNSTDQWKSVNTHLHKALEMLSDRKNPDYRNSIKESISGVEATCGIITGDNNATLGKALSEIEKKHALHGALKTAFSAIYGYTSDAHGIRHALTESGADVTFADAKFILVSCSAFINYLKSKLK